MENAIRKIIEIEHKAQDLVAQGYDQTERIRLDTLEEIKSMERSIEESANHKINELKEKLRLETDEKLGKIKENMESKIKILEEYVEKNRDIWEEEIFLRVISR